MDGLALNTHGCHLALTLFIRLLGVDEQLIYENYILRKKKKKRTRSTLIIVVTTTARQMPDSSKNHSPEAKIPYIHASLLSISLTWRSGQL